MPEKIKRLRVLAGPNGSGKSTVVHHILQYYYCGSFLNADELHTALARYKKVDAATFALSISKTDFDSYLATAGKSWVDKAHKDGQVIHLQVEDNHLVVTDAPGAYDAAIAADFLRYQLIGQEDTFTFETVLSDARKIDFLLEAQKKGFRLYLYFVCTESPEINKTRVANRVIKGGHDVPISKIEARYYDSLKVLKDLIPHAYRCFLFDNSEEGDAGSINLVAEIEQGEKLTIHSADVPGWVQEYVLEPLFNL